MNKHASWLILLIAPATWGQTIHLPNPSFEKGGETPAGWTLSGGQGRWLDGDAADGRRSIAVSGRGEGTNYWRSGPIAFEPAAVYRLRFRARHLGGSGGTPIIGPVFCNRDLHRISDRWQAYELIFVAPAAIDPAQAWLRFGQWHLDGSVAFDGIELTRADPLYRGEGDVVLGQGERLEGRRYVFRAPFHSRSANHSRPLAYHRCNFNTNRWVFGTGSEVVYRHRVGTRRQTAATVEVGVTWYASGDLTVEAGTDGKTWRRLGVIDAVAGRRYRIPDEMLPAEEVWVRLRARAAKRVGQNSDPGSLQVGTYGYEAALDGPPAHLVGATHFVAVTAADPRLKISIQGIGDGLPGGDNTLRATVTNTTARAIAARPTVTLEQPGRKPITAAIDATLPPGAQTLAIPYRVPGTGRFDLRFTLGSGIAYRAESRLIIPELYSIAYGRRLPDSTEAVALWWASSGWKVSRTRPVPKAAGQAVVIRAARNEAEAAQLIVRPARPLKNFRVGVAALAGPRGALIPPDVIDVLKVRYVQVTRPTDDTGAAAPWPDPLPPLTGPIDLPAEKNQPLWLRVKVPRGSPAGRYEGVITLTADGYAAQVPLRVEVYDFDLPDRMTCTTAFGFWPDNVWRYQRITDPVQRRMVLEKYWANFSAHHISPYDPAPLDPFKVTWPTVAEWQGGNRDQRTGHSGKSSLVVTDRSTTKQVSASYRPLIPIGKKGFRLRFWYKTERPGHRFIVTLDHYDAHGKWLPGRNNDIPIAGDATWQRFERRIRRFPPKARSVRLRLWAALWKEDGSTTGRVWFDDVSLQDAATGKQLLRGGDFEPLDPVVLKPVFDWSAWDRAMRRALDRYHFNTFRVPIVGLGSGSFHSRVEPSLLGYPENTPHYRAAFGAYCRGLQEHLRKNGWLDEAFVYWFDEPAPKDYAFVMNGFGKLKQAAPEINRMLTEQVEPDLIGGPNIWCPVSYAYEHAPAEARRRLGEKFWWYVCTGPKAPYCTLFIDHPATELRVWLWQTWQRKIDGILVWQSNYWTSPSAYPDPKNPQNPYEDPMGWVVDAASPPGLRRPWGNGDGRFIYPPEAAADAHPPAAVLDGPVDSIRWEMLRDGIEDYEYLAILRRMLSAHAFRLASDQRRHYATFLEVPEDITADMTSFTKDPEPIERRRHAIARAIEQLGKL